MDDSRTNEQIIAEIQQGIEVTANLQHLYEKNQPLTKMLCKKYQMGLPFDDCLQEAYIALWDAVRLYNSEKGKFSNYLGYWIRHKLVRLQYQSKPIRLPIYLEGQIYQYERFCKDYEMRNGRFPQEGEIASALNISVTDVANIQKAKSINVVSLDAPQATESEDLFLSDIIADTNTDVEQDAISTVMSDVLNEEIKKTLTPSQRQAVHLVFVRGLKYRQAAAQMGVTATRIGQLVQVSLEKLRMGIAHKYFTEMEESEALVYGGSYEQWQRTRTSAEEKIVCKNETAWEELVERIRKMCMEQTIEM